MADRKTLRHPHLPPRHPGALLREVILPSLDISVSGAAERLHVTRQTLHRILAETAAVTPEMALRFGKFCGNGPDLWQCRKPMTSGMPSGISAPSSRRSRPRAREAARMDGATTKMRLASRHLRARLCAHARPLESTK